MREISVAEQRYQAVLAVISDGLSISQVASKVKVFYAVSDLCTAHRASWPICARTG